MITATLLVLFAGFTHASWNLISKRTRAGADFVMLNSALSCLVYAPVALFAFRAVDFSFDLRVVGIAALSGLIHFCYALTLQNGYQRADLAIVYPTARGTGPLLSGIAAVTLLGEQLTLAAALGAALVIGGIVLVGIPTGRTSGPDRRAAVRGLLFGVATGVFIATYTVVDAIAVRSMRLPPILLDYMSNITRTLIFLPAMAVRREGLAQAFRAHRTACLLVAALMPLSYIIVLYAMRMAPVSRIAPMREVSVLFGVLGASLVLGEPFGWRRIAGAVLITSGVVLLSLR